MSPSPQRGRNDLTPGLAYAAVRSVTAHLTPLVPWGDRGINPVLTLVLCRESAPVPAARLSNKPFVPPQRIKKRPGQAGTPPEFKLLLYWCGEVRVGYALRRGILKPPLARGAGGLGKLASLALLARWPAGFAGALPPITAAPPSAARQHQTLSPVPPSSAALSPAARAVTHPASCSSSSRTNLVLHCCGR